jgi:hypothetical protein
VVLTVTLPDATSATPTVTGPVSGTWSATYVTSQAGRHAARWTGGGQAFTDAFDVAAADAGGVVSLADAKAHLGKTSTTDDEEMRRFIAAATEFIEGEIGGPVVRTTKTEVVTGHGVRTRTGVSPGFGDLIFLTYSPVIQLLSVTTSTGTTYDVSSLYLDAEAGIVTPGTGYSLPRPLFVVYDAGYGVIPALLQQAALDYIKWLWQSQRGPTPLPQPGDEFETVTPATVPYRITQALTRFRRPVLA